MYMYVYVYVYVHVYVDAWGGERGRKPPASSPSSTFSPACPTPASRSQGSGSGCILDLKTSLDTFLPNHILILQNLSNTPWSTLVLPKTGVRVEPEPWLAPLDEPALKPWPRLISGGLVLRLKMQHLGPQNKPTWIRPSVLTINRAKPFDHQNLDAGCCILSLQTSPPGYRLTFSRSSLAV